MATLRKRGGKYQAVIRRKGFPATSRTFHLKSDAQQWARHMDVRADRGDLPTPLRVLEGYKVRDILERYRDQVTVKKRSAETETYIINSFLRERIANLTLAQINTVHFSTYREERLKKVKPGTANRQFNIIRHAFDVAMLEWDVPLRENPLAKLKKLKVNDARSRRLKAQEWEAIKTAAIVCRNPFIMPLIRLAIETAMRRGELLAMKWEHVNFENRTILIPVTKNGHKRIIPMTGEAVRVLKEIQDMKQADARYVFPGITGMRIGGKTDQAALVENLLRISGEDSVTVARKYKDDWQGKLSTRFFIMTNELPKLHDPSGALASRFIPIVMTQSFLNQENPNLANELITELPAILNWAIEGWERLHTRGRFLIPPASAELMGDIADLGSPVLTFVKEMCVMESEARIPKTRLYEAFRSWQRERGDPLSGDSASFGRDLKAAFHGRIKAQKSRNGKHRTAIYVGIKLAATASNEKMPF